MLTLFIGCIIEVVVFNVLLAITGMWTIIACCLGTLTAALVIIITVVKIRYGFYEGKKVNPYYTILISEGMTLLVLILYIMLLRWRSS